MGRGSDRAALIRGVQLAARAAAAATLSVVVAEILGLRFPIYAMIAAVIVTDLSAAETRRLGIPRLIGTVVGASVGALLSPVLSSGAGAIAIGILVAMLLTTVARISQAGKVAGYVSGIVLLEYSANPWIYAADRFVETALGIGMAVLVSLVPKLIRVESPEDPEPRVTSR